MGFKSSLAIARATRLKKQYSSTFSPPATPFNNTSFLIRLLQQREQYNSRSSSTKHGQFDQYGSMDSMIAISFAAPASPQIEPTISWLHLKKSSNIYKECSQNTECSTSRPMKGVSDSRERRRIPRELDRDAIVQQLSSSSEDTCSTITEVEIESDPEMGEGDGRLRMQHRQDFVDDNFDTHSE